LSDVVRKAIEQHIGGELIEPIMENTTISADGLSEEVRRQRPDITIVRREGERECVDIIEFTCPYGQRSHGRDTLEQAFQYKKEKYSRLTKEIYDLKGAKTRIIPVIVSSMGAVYGESMKALKQLLKCQDKGLRKLGVQMSTTVIIGSHEIWREFVRERKNEDVEEDRKEEVDEVYEREVEENVADDEAVEEEEDDEASERVGGRRMEVNEDVEVEATVQEVRNEDI
jgi:hypothetical protein